jgi:hypothetical protein
LSKEITIYQWCYSAGTHRYARTGSNSFRSTAFWFIFAKTHTKLTRLWIFPKFFQNSDSCVPVQSHLNSTTAIYIKFNVSTNYFIGFFRKNWKNITPNTSLIFKKVSLCQFLHLVVSLITETYKISVDVSRNMYSSSGPKICYIFCCYDWSKWLVVFLVDWPVWKFTPDEHLQKIQGLKRGTYFSKFKIYLSKILFILIDFLSLLSLRVSRCFRSLYG